MSTFGSQSILKNSKYSRAPASNQPDLSERTQIKKDKKYEGYSDINRSAMSMSKKIQGIQRTTDEKSVEEEYIKSLQDEIKYMEYELKLLKDKELEQLNSYSFLDKFFNDGVPLNEHILAMKNKYVLENEQKLKKLETLKKMLEQEKNNFNNMNEENDYNKHKMDELDSERQERQDKELLLTDELRKQFFTEHHLRNDYQQEFQKLKNLLKKYNNENSQTQREFEKRDRSERIENENHDLQREKVNRDLDATLKTVKDIDLGIYDIETLNVITPYEVDVQNDIEKIEGKLSFARRDISEANLRKSDLQHQREKLYEDLDKITQTKTETELQIDDTKEKLDIENNLTDYHIQLKAEQQEKAEISDLTRQLDGITKQFDHASNRLMNSQNVIDTVGMEKVDEQNLELELQQQKEDLEKEVQEYKQQWLEVRIRQKLVNAKLIEIKQNVETPQAEIEQIEQELPRKKEDILKLKQLLEFYDKKVELTKYLRNFNVDNIKLVLDANNTIMSSINDLSKKWDKIQNFRSTLM